MPPLPYFAYGRNMAAGAMELACPGHRYLGPARLPDHRLAFTRRPLRAGAGVAVVIEAAGEQFGGALYGLDDAGPAALDEKEGNGWSYEPRRMRVVAAASPG